MLFLTSHRALEQALRNGQAFSFIIRDMGGEARLAELAFNVGSCMLAKFVHFLSQQLEL